MVQESKSQDVAQGEESKPLGRNESATTGCGFQAEHQVDGKECEVRRCCGVPSLGWKFAHFVEMRPVRIQEGNGPNREDKKRRVRRETKPV